MRAQADKRFSSQLGQLYTLVSPQTVRQHALPRTLGTSVCGGVPE